MLDLYSWRNISPLGRKAFLTLSSTCVFVYKLNIMFITIMLRLKWIRIFYEMEATQNSVFISLFFFYALHSCLLTRSHQKFQEDISSPAAQYFKEKRKAGRCLKTHTAVFPTVSFRAAPQVLQGPLWGMGHWLLTSVSLKTVTVTVGHTQPGAGREKHGNASLNQSTSPGGAKRCHHWVGKRKMAKAAGSQKESLSRN